MTMSKEQQHIFEQAILCGLVKNARQAYEIGCGALRPQLDELKAEEKAKFEAAQRAESEAISRNQLSLFPGQADSC